MSPAKAEQPAEGSGPCCTSCGAPLEPHHNYCSECGTHVAHRPRRDDDRGDRGDRDREGARPWWFLLVVLLVVLATAAVILLGVVVGLLINDNDAGAGRVITCSSTRAHERARCSTTDQNHIEIRISVNGAPPSTLSPPPPPVWLAPPKVAG